MLLLLLLLMLLMLLLLSRSLSKMSKGRVLGLILEVQSCLDGDHADLDSVHGVLRKRIRASRSSTNRRFTHPDILSSL